MARKIYLSPSDQVRNIYAYGSTNEAVQCRAIAAACKSALERCGFEARTNTTDGTNAMYERVNESNAWGADMHICIHTNAGGGRGAEAYVAEKDAARLAAAQPIYDEVRKISLYGSTRGIKTAGYYEIRNTSALCVYLEVDFHDNESIARWIINNTDAIGEAICRGVCTYYGVDYVADDGSAPAVPVRTVQITLPVLRKGSTGAEVKTVQRILKQLGYVGADGKVLSIDGRFEENTERAVRKFQEKRGSTLRDGIVGVWTWGKLLQS